MEQINTVYSISVSCEALFHLREIMSLLDLGIVCDIFTMGRRGQMGTKKEEQKKQKPSQGFLKVVEKHSRKRQTRSTSEWAVLGEKARREYVGIITDRKDERYV